MLSEYQLTIGIPTYNRSEFLKITVDNLIKQIQSLDAKICILISDNGSDDGTVELAERYCLENEFIFFRQNKTNQGFPGNFLSILKEVDSNYLWTMGDDDFIAENALKRIYNEINTNRYEIININRYKCTYSLEKRSIDRFYHTDKDEVFLIDNHDIDSIYNFFTKVKTFDGIFCFVSSLVFKKEFFKSMVAFTEKENISFINYFPHVYLIMKTFAHVRQTRLLYISDPLVYWRSDNSSKYENTVIKKTFVNLMHMIEVAERLKHDNMLYADGILSATRKKLGVKNFLIAGIKGNNSDYRYLCDINKHLPRRWYADILNYSAYLIGRNWLFRLLVRLIFRKKHNAG